MKSNGKRGLFIVLEGIDGAGTTTQSQALAEFLIGQGERAVVTSQPSRGPVGRLVRSILKGEVKTDLPGGDQEPIDPATVALLFAADRIQHLKSVIEPHLAAGTHVICDRYVVSSLVYQGVEVAKEFVERINSLALIPSMILFVNVDPKVAMRRIMASRSGLERFEHLPFLEQVAENYKLDLAAYEGCPVLEVDGHLPISEVTRDLCNAIDSLRPS